MKLRCKCDNLLESNHGRLSKDQEGKFFYLFYCGNCHRMIAVDKDDPDHPIYDYSLEEIR